MARSNSSAATGIYDALRRSVRVTAQAMKEAADAADAVSAEALSDAGAEALRAASSRPPPERSEEEDDDGADPVP